MDVFDVSRRQLDVILHIDLVGVVLLHQRVRLIGHKLLYRVVDRSSNDSVERLVARIYANLKVYNINNFAQIYTISLTFSPG